MKSFVLVIKILLAMIAIAIGLFIIAKIKIKNNLDTKLIVVKVEWESLSRFQNKNQLYTYQLTQLFPDLAKSNDSIGFLLEQHQNNKINYSNCNDTLIANQFNLNESFLVLKRQISDTIRHTATMADSLLNLMEENMELLNKSVKQYNSKVREFNLYYSTFPVFLFAKSSGIKRQVYFEITYGVPNEDPIAKKNEIPDWQRKIEEENGLVE